MHCSVLVVFFSLSECWEAYNSSKPAKETCSLCGEALAFVEGKFSGSFLKLGDGIKVHGTWCIFSAWLCGLAVNVRGFAAALPRSRALLLEAGQVPPNVMC